MMVVNAYKMTRRYYKMKVTKVPYGYHKFQEKISYGFIDTVHKWPRRVDHTHVNNGKIKAASTKIKASAMSESSPRSPKVSKSSLDPETGSLNNFLDPSLEHLPFDVPGKNMTPICQLHRLTARQIVEVTNIPDGACASFMRCFMCGVNLCLP